MSGCPGAFAAGRRLARCRPSPLRCQAWWSRSRPGTRHAGSRAARVGVTKRVRQTQDDSVVGATSDPRRFVTHAFARTETSMTHQDFPVLLAKAQAHVADYL